MSYPLLKGSLYSDFILLFIVVFLRFSRRNIMLAGLWFAKTKPTMTTYIMPLIMSINELYEKGKDCRCQTEILILRNELRN